ncbi:MAG TPA: SpoVR family protein [Planctomycetota bacterium]|nr:SpoVR family protein [Planctomycetota bacterium]
MNLPDNLLRLQFRIRDAAREEGLDFFETIFEILPADALNEVAAYGGFPTRYPHWRHGMEYEHLSKGYRYGLSKIYELVINNDPCYAYLMSGNSLVEQKLVMAHVYGHCDFFKNNAWFAHTDRRMIDRMANHAVRVRVHMDRHGQSTVEDFLDRALSIDNLIDLHGLYAPPKEPERPPVDPDEADDEALRTRELKKLRSKDYMDPFINPKEFLERKRRRMEEEAERKRRFPSEPDRDVMRFLIENAPLERWERELLEQVRDEAVYFAPQRMTKIMNEGWASYWHRKLMAERLLTDAEAVEYAQTMAATLAGGSSINPYKIGLELWRDIEDRWDRGRHGLEYEACDDLEKKRTWDDGAKAGREMIFRVRRAYCDSTFIDEFLTEEVCHEQKLFVYRWNPQTQRKEIATRDFAGVKAQLLRQLANGGAPVIEAVDADHDGRGELLLVHRFDGVELRRDYAQATLRNIQKMWRRPCVLLTRGEERSLVYRTDGNEDRVDETADG